MDFKFRLSTFVILLGAIFYFSSAFWVGAETRPPFIIHNVPFTSQAPLGEWSDPRQADGCEEAAIVMAMAWARGGGDIPAEEAKRDIVNISEYEKVIWGFFQDTSIADTARLMRDIYGHSGVMVQDDIGAENIKDALAAGNVVIVPINTQMTGLVKYKNGPPRHTVIAVGYDEQQDKIIMHDPYTGGAYDLQLSSSALNNSLWDYHSGIHLNAGPKRSAMIVVPKMPGY